MHTTTAHVCEETNLHAQQRSAVTDKAGRPTLVARVLDDLDRRCHAVKIILA